MRVLFLWFVVVVFLMNHKKTSVIPIVMPYTSRRFLSKQEDKKHMSEGKIRTYIKRLNWGFIKASLVHKHYWHTPFT